MGAAAIATPEAKALAPRTDCIMNTRRVVIEKSPLKLNKKIGSRARFGASLTLKPEPTLNENSKKQG
jgi:hypothetical protein